MKCDQSPYRILDIRGFDSSRILISRGGILVPKGKFLEVSSQRILAGIILVGRLGVMSTKFDPIFQNLILQQTLENRICFICQGFSRVQGFSGD